MASQKSGIVFSDSDVRKLLQCYVEHAAVLTSKLNNTITADRKNTWQSIAMEVNSIEATTRTVEGFNEFKLINLIIIFLI